MFNVRLRLLLIISEYLPLALSAFAASTPNPPSLPLHAAIIMPSSTPQPVPVETAENIEMGVRLVSLEDDGFPPRASGSDRGTSCQSL